MRCECFNRRRMLGPVVFLWAVALLGWPGVAAGAEGPRSKPVEGATSHLDVAYLPDRVVGAYQDRWVKLDVHVPPGEGPFPCVVYVHGGLKRLFYFDEEVTQFVPGKPPTRIVTAPGASESSYGINNAVRDFQGDASVLLVDYNKIVANVVQPEGTDLWASMSAPRHTGRINTLTGDGRVIARTREAIDPSIPAVHDDLWLPHLRAARQGG